MKKFLFAIMIFALSATSATAQSRFVSPGVTLQNSAISNTVELGLSYNKVTYSLQYGYTYTGHVNSVSGNVYNKIVGVKKTSLWLYNSLTMDCKTQYFTYAPGLSVACQATKRLQPQFTFSLPLVNNQTSPGYSLSLGYSF